MELEIVGGMLHIKTSVYLADYLVDVHLVSVLLVLFQAAKHSSFNGKPLIMKWYSPKVPAPYSHPHQPPHVTPSLLQPAPQPLSLPLFFSSNADPTSKSPEVADNPSYTLPHQLSCV